ncbi:trehalose-6-phosphate synthase domain protein [Cooperia oncophora]
MKWHVDSFVKTSVVLTAPFNELNHKDHTTSSFCHTTCSFHVSSISSSIYQVLANSGEGGCFFFSVERFDYTKGIMEKLRAWRRYFEKHPERKGLDVLYQIAVTNRRAVESYKRYQDSCLELAKEINESIRSESHPDWRPLRFDTDGLPRARLIAHYLAMDIGVVTPSKDGMNLVAKEMMVCNPSASLVLSSGAGTEVQLGNAGFYSEDKKCYHRVDDIADIENFAEVFYRAATEENAVRQEHGGRLNQFLKSHDIDEWSSAFLDPSWTHEVIRPTEIRQIADFYMLMAQTAQIRRQIVEVVLKGMPIRPHFALSLENAKNSLENCCMADSNLLVLETTSHTEDDDSVTNAHATFDITDELTELQKDLAFLSFIQSDETNNVEQFVDTLGSFHPSGPTAFAAEVEKAAALLTQGDHFHYVFTDRDGTLKSYSCSYPTSVQPAYSAVIQAQFARRCAQFCAIVTTAPLVHIGILNMSTIPEAMQFKDDSVSDADLMLLNKAFDMIEDLLERPEYRNFTWIGSGLQKHYGHITIAKQDVNNSIPPRKSLQL